MSHPVLQLDGWKLAETIRKNTLQRAYVYVRSGDEHAGGIAREAFMGTPSKVQPEREHNWGGKVFRIEHTPAAKTYYVKAITPASPRFLHKPWRGRNALLQEERAQDLGFGAPRAVALLESWTLGVLTASYLVTEEVACDTSLFRMLNKPEFGFTLEGRPRRVLLRKLGDEAARWHTAGLFHGDMHLNNVLCRCDPEHPGFVWIDNEEGRYFPHGLPEAQRLHDLAHLFRARLNVSLMDRAALWDAYAGTAGFSPTERRRLRNRVAGEVQRYRTRRGWA